MIHTKKYLGMAAVGIITASFLLSACGNDKQSETEAEDTAIVIEVETSSDIQILKNCIVKVSGSSQSGGAVGTIADESAGSGTGFFVEEGYIVVASNVVDSGGDLTVTYPDGTESGATLVSNDIETNTALLRVEEPHAKALELDAEVDEKEGKLFIPAYKDGEEPLIIEVKRRVKKEAEANEDVAKDTKAEEKATTEEEKKEETTTAKEEKKEETTAKEAAKETKAEEKTTAKEEKKEETTTAKEAAKEPVNPDGLIEIDPIEDKSVVGAPVFNEDGEIVGTVGAVDPELGFSVVIPVDKVADSVEEQVEDQKIENVAADTKRDNIVTDYIEQNYEIDTSYIYSTAGHLKGETVTKNAQTRFYVDQLNSNVIKLSYKASDKKNKANVNVNIGAKEKATATATTDKGTFTVDVNRINILPGEEGTILLYFEGLQGTVNKLELNNVTDLDKDSSIVIDLAKGKEAAAPQENDRVKAAEAYLEYLQEHEDEIRWIEDKWANAGAWEYTYGEEVEEGAYWIDNPRDTTVAFADLNADDVPELFVMGRGEELRYNVYNGVADDGEDKGEYIKLQGISFNNEILNNIFEENCSGVFYGGPPLLEGGTRIYYLITDEDKFACLTRSGQPGNFYIVDYREFDFNEKGLSVSEEKSFNKDYNNVIDRSGFSTREEFEQWENDTQRIYDEDIEGIVNSCKELAFCKYKIEEMDDSLVDISMTYDEAIEYLNKIINEDNEKTTEEATTETKPAETTTAAETTTEADTETENAARAIFKEIAGVEYTGHNGTWGGTLIVNEDGTFELSSGTFRPGFFQNNEVTGRFDVTPEGDDGYLFTATDSSGTQTGMYSDAEGNSVEETKETDVDGAKFYLFRAGSTIPETYRSLFAPLGNSFDPSQVLDKDYIAWGDIDTPFMVLSETDN